MNGAPYIGADAKAKQREALLNALHRGTVSTIQAREQLGISHPAGRVFELRRLGWRISTLASICDDDQGRPHKCASYRLNLKVGSAE